MMEQHQAAERWICEWVLNAQHEACFGPDTESGRCWAAMVPVDYDRNLYRAACHAVSIVDQPRGAWTYPGQENKMTQIDYVRAIQEDATLEVGQHVAVYWTYNSGSHQSGVARIDKLNKKSLRVVLQKGVETADGNGYFPPGGTIVVARAADTKGWGPWNRVERISEEAPCRASGSSSEATARP
jgi:hypothetical protein